jgi:hypothetical protein
MYDVKNNTSAVYVIIVLPKWPNDWYWRLPICTTLSYGAFREICDLL